MRVAAFPSVPPRRGWVFAAALAALLLPLVAQEAVPEPASEEREPARLRARSLALESAHALAVAENGSRRSVPWEGWLGVSGETVIPMQLFRGHSYHLIVGTSIGDGGLRAELFDGMGKRVEVVTRTASGRIILTVAPGASGTYHLRLRSEPDGTGGAVALTYVYR